MAIPANPWSTRWLLQHDIKVNGDSNQHKSGMLLSINALVS